MLIQNVQILAGEIVRQVAIKEDGTINTVVKAIRYGKKEKLGTYQDYEIGDYIMYSRELLGMPEEYPAIISFLKVVEDGKRVVQTTLTPAFKAVTDDIRDWLLNGGTDANLPPCGGWDGTLTLLERAKRDNFRNLFSDVNNTVQELDLIQEIVDAAMVSPRFSVNFNWKHATAIPRDPVVLLNGENIIKHFRCIFEEDYSFIEAIMPNDEPHVSCDLSNRDIQRAIVGTITKTPYGQQVAWKLYK